MATNTQPWQIKLRRDTAALWMLKNPIMLLDEVGLETDSRKFKIGNGITPWRLLPYGTIGGPDNLLLFISEEMENRLRYGADGGLYVPEYNPNPLAYYILAKS